ncbi:protein FMC1 homolog isoform X2 [Dendrobates tinctorius]|uniref:protein FMC1 homolog isoform X2 n=1 Tax=Dendrobates tinctorius TaxID=92724 RepID=UPI003CCA554D
MASLGTPLHTYRSLLRELRQICSVDRYGKTTACGFIREQFRRNQSSPNRINNIPVIERVVPDVEIQSYRSSLKVCHIQEKKKRNKENYKKKE